MITGAQARVFAHFCAVFDDLVARDKSEGNYDDGVVDLRANGITTKRNLPFYTDTATGAAVLRAVLLAVAALLLA